MPNNDKTGPKGKGSKTGRGLGKCNSEDQQNSQISGRGSKKGSGQGRGQRNQSRS